MVDGGTIGGGGAYCIGAGRSDIVKKGTNHINKLMISDAHTHNKFIFSSLDGSYKRIVEFIKYFIPYSLFYFSVCWTWNKQE
jgi:hypothetical protein